MRSLARHSDVMPLNERRFDLRGLLADMEPNGVEVRIRILSGSVRRLQVTVGNDIIVEGHAHAVLEMLVGADPNLDGT